MVTQNKMMMTVITWNIKKSMKAKPTVTKKWRNYIRGIGGSDMPAGSVTHPSR